MSVAESVGEQFAAIWEWVQTSSSAEVMKLLLIVLLLVIGLKAAKVVLKVAALAGIVFIVWTYLIR